MSEVLRISKRILTVSVVVTTIAWSIGFAAFVMPMAADAATLATGDLIKASMAAVYYYADDGKRYVFPNENTYYSWYPDFSGVKEITDSELADIPIGGNITIRPGTFLVKITTDPKVYAVTTGGMLHWVESEDIASKLWLSNWADWVVDVPDSFFVNYTLSGDSVGDYTHPDGCLIKYASDATVYLVEDGEKRAIADEAAFNANMFQWRFVISPLGSDVTYPDGTTVSGKEAGLVDLTAGASGAGTGLTVTLASDTPAGATVAKGSSGVSLIKIGVKASSDGNVILNSLKFKRSGVGTAADFDNVYLYEGSSRLTSGRSINSTSNEVQFNNLGIDIAAGATHWLTVKGDVAAGAIAGDEHALGLADTDAVGTAATVSGSFPITGNTFTIGAQGAATLVVTKGSTPANPTIGESNATISSFKMQANGADISINQISLLQAGTVTNSDITNLTLWAGSTQVASASVLDGDQMVFVLDTPYTINDGNTRTFYVKASVVGKANRTIRTYVEFTTDVQAIDNTYGWGASVDIGATSGTFDGVGTNFIEVTTQGGEVTVAFVGPETGSIPKAGDEQVMYQFNLTAAETDIEIRKLSFSLLGVNNDDIIDASGTDLFTDIKVIDDSTGMTLMGPTQISSANSTTLNPGGDIKSATWILTDSFFIDAGETMQLAILADVANNAWFNSDRQYQVRLNAFGADYVKEVDTGDYVPTTKIVPNTAILGNTQTVRATSLTVQLASSPVSDTYVKRTEDVPSVGFLFNAGTQSDVLITNIKLSGQGNINGGGYLAASLSDVVTELTLWDGTTQIGSAKSPGTAGTATFDSLNWTIPAGESKTLTVKTTLDSVATVGGVDDTFWVGIAAATDITAEDEDNNTVTPSDGAAPWDNPVNNAPTVFQTVKDSGTLTISPESNPDSDILVAGKDVWNTFVQARATAQWEEVRLDKVRVIRLGGGQNVDFKYIGIMKDGVLVSSGTDTLPSVATTTDITLTSPITIPADGDVTFQVVAKLNSIANGAVSGDNPTLAIDNNFTTGDWDANYAGQYNVLATGVGSGERIYAVGATPLAGNMMVVRKTKLTIAKQSVSPATLANTELELYKMQITADSAGSAGIAKIGFTLNKTGAFTVNNLKWLRDGTNINTSVAIVDAAGNNLEGVNDASGSIFVSYNSGTEQTISGSGHIFTLKGTVSGAGTGESLGVLLSTTSSAAVITDNLNNTVYGAYQAPNLEGIGDYFIWSDKSAIPHDAKDGGSADWTNDYLLKQLGDSVVLSFS